MNCYKVIDGNGLQINIKASEVFKVPELNKEYIAYSVMDTNENNPNGGVLLGEFIRTGDKVEVLGILTEEKEIVVQYYNQRLEQLGGDING